MTPLPEHVLRAQKRAAERSENTRADAPKAKTKKATKVKTKKGKK